MPPKKDEKKKGDKKNLEVKNFTYM